MTRNINAYLAALIVTLFGAAATFFIVNAVYSVEPTAYAQVDPFSASAVFPD